MPRQAAAPALVAGVQTLVLEDFPSVELARNLSANGRAHWGVKNRERLTVNARVVIAAQVHGLQPVSGPVRLTFVWVFPRGGRHDLDNLIGSGVTKHAIDSLVRRKYIPDDDSGHVVDVKAEVRVERGRRALEIVLTPVKATT